MAVFLALSFAENSKPVSAYCARNLVFQGSFFGIWQTVHGCICVGDLLRVEAVSGNYFQEKLVRIRRCAPEFWRLQELFLLVHGVLIY